MSRAQFFFGLDPEGLEVTLDEYVNRAGWRVHTIGLCDGFWILLEQEEER